MRPSNSPHGQAKIPRLGNIPGNIPGNIRQLSNPARQSARNRPGGLLTGVAGHSIRGRAPAPPPCCCGTHLIEPCLRSPAEKPPTGEAWLHEIKYDGFRVVARKDGDRMRLYSRPGNDLTYRFSLIVGTLVRLRSRSCIIDGEAVACGDDGVPSFDRIRYRRHDASVFPYAFDLIELNGDNLRREPLAVRKATLASLLRFKTKFNVESADDILRISGTPD
jgi:ATP dependent DNA ligase domain